MINKILEITFSGFWQFVGMAILLNGFAFYIVNFFVRIWTRFMRMIMVRKHGWPPAHLDDEWRAFFENHLMRDSLVLGVDDGEIQDMISINSYSFDVTECSTC